MSRSRLRRTLVLLSLLPIPLGTGAQEEHATRPATISSLSEEDAAAMSREIAAKVEAIRGLAFQKKVPVEVVDDATARAHFQRRFERLIPRERLRAQQIAYEQLGLLPEGMDLVAFVFDLLEEQAGGYYDPEEETFFLLDDMPRRLAPLLMAHELTHALDDQHFDIDGMLRDVLHDDDRTAAVNAVVEGSGTLVMMVFSMRELMEGRLTVEALAELEETEAGQAEKMLAAPPVLQRAFLGPYLLGQMFLIRGDLGRVATGPDAEDVNRAFRDPPESFEQILHPEKYWDEETRDRPRPVSLPDLGVVLGPGWSVRGGGTLGELDIAMLTGSTAVPAQSLDALSASAWTNDAAAGWGGDRWVLLSNGARHATVLATVWDTEEDAAEFAAALNPRLGVAVERRRDAVVVVVGDVGDRTGPLAAAALEALTPELPLDPGRGASPGPGGSARGGSPPRSAGATGSDHPGGHRE